MMPAKDEMVAAVQEHLEAVEAAIGEALEYLGASSEPTAPLGALLPAQARMEKAVRLLEVLRDYPAVFSR
jgi:hypothetical protein